MNPSFRPNCDMLIDQNRYIDSDPIGHCCGLPATHIVDKTHFICERCAALLRDGSDRITIPSVGSVEGWEDRVRSAIESMMTQMDALSPAHN